MSHPPPSSQTAFEMKCVSLQPTEPVHRAIRKGKHIIDISEPWRSPPPHKPSSVSNVGGHEAVSGAHPELHNSAPAHTLREQPRGKHDEERLLGIPKYQTQSQYSGKRWVL